MSKWGKKEIVLVPKILEVVKQPSEAVLSFLEAVFVFFEAGERVEIKGRKTLYR